MEQDRDPEMEELLGRFAGRLDTSAAFNREAIGYRFFRRLAATRQDAGSAALRHHRQRRPRRPWSWLPFSPVEGRGSLKSRAAPRREAPAVVVIDQTGRTVEGSGIARRAGAGGAAERVVAAFVLGCLCGLLLAQLLGLDVVGMLRQELGVAPLQLPAVTGVPPGALSPTAEAAFAVTKTVEPSQQVGDRADKEQAATDNPKGAEFVRPAGTVALDHAATPAPWQAPEGWGPSPPQTDTARIGAGSPAPGPTSTPAYAPAFETQRVVTGTPEGLISASPTSPPAQATKENPR